MRYNARVIVIDRYYVVIVMVMVGEFSHVDKKLTQSAAGVSSVQQYD